MGFLASTTVTFVVGVAVYALVMELALLAFGRSGILLPIPRHWVPWALLGALGTSAVLSGLVEKGLPGDVAIRLISVLRWRRFASGVLWRLKPPGDSDAGKDRWYSIRRRSAPR